MVSQNFTLCTCRRS